jgi:hypothetical protein
MSYHSACGKWVSNECWFYMWLVGTILHQLELECRWKHTLQWLYGWAHSGLGCGTRMRKTIIFALRIFDSCLYLDCRWMLDFSQFDLQWSKNSGQDFVWKFSPILCNFIFCLKMQWMFPLFTYVKLARVVHLKLSIVCCLT